MRALVLLIDNWFLSAGYEQQNVRPVLFQEKGWLLCFLSALPISDN
jgi:hypothetical protein